MNLKSSFLFCYASRNKFVFEIIVFVFCQCIASVSRSSIRPSVPVALILRPSVRSSIRSETSEICGNERIRANKRQEPLLSENLLFQRVATFARSSVQPSVSPSRLARPFLHPNGRKSARFCGNKRIRGNGRSPLFFREGWLGRQLRWRILNPKPSTLNPKMLTLAGFLYATQVVHESIFARLGELDIDDRLKMKLDGLGTFEARFPCRAEKMAIVDGRCSCRGTQGSLRRDAPRTRMELDF